MSAIEAGVPRSRALAAHGIESLKQGDLLSAQAVFNAALKLDITNASLHLLNGIAYHLRYLAGEQDTYALARVAYASAIQFNDTLPEAYVQLGRLYLAGAEYGSAKRVFAAAAAIDPASPSAFYGLAHAALFEGDMATAAFGVHKLKEMRWDSPLSARLDAAVLALAGRLGEAAERAAEYERRTGGSADSRHLLVRLRRIGTVAQIADLADAKERPLQVAVQDRATKSPVSSSPPPSAEPKSAWFRCDTAPAIPPQEGLKASPDQTASDETLLAPVLPRPCADENPPLAVVEVTMIRNEEVESKQFGVNLLEGLTAVFRSVKTYTSTGDSAGTEITRSYGFAAGASASDFLTYSLNVANAGYARSEVIARPTLAVIDRVPAIFFSGATITLGITGQSGSSPTIVDKPIGVSLAVTPTFVDNDSVLLSIRATRSFLTSGLSSSSSVLLQQTRTMISASGLLKFGESFVLTGLDEKEGDRTDSGVPVLSSVPVVQYLFSQKKKYAFNRQILVLLTVRKVVATEAETVAARSVKDGASRHMLSKNVDEFVALQKNRPVVDSLLGSLSKGNEMYRRLRDGDVALENWSDKGRLRRMLDELKELIFF